MQLQLEAKKNGNGESKTAWLYDQLSVAVQACPVGTRFLSDREICRQFGISQPVVRGVMATLVRQGLIRRAPGRGSFVQSHVPEPDTAKSLKIAVFTCLGTQTFPHHHALNAIERVLNRGRHDLIVRANDLAVMPNLDHVALKIDDALRGADGVIWISACSRKPGACRNGCARRSTASCASTCGLRTTAPQP